MLQRVTVRSVMFRTMTNRFAVATAVEPVVVDANVGGRFRAEVHEGWDIGGNANGGYLMAIGSRAIAETVGRPPLTVTGHFLRPAPAGPCEIETSVVRVGRRLSTATATLSIAGSPTLQLLGSFGEQQRGGASMQMNEPVELPPHDEIPPSPMAGEGPAPALMQQVDIRIRPGDGGFRTGAPSSEPVMNGWFALASDEPIDALGLILAADAFPPPIFNSGLPVAWVPTIELTVHIRGVPASGPLRCSFRSRFIHDGLLDEEGEIWDSTGTLVCQSRQLSLMPR
jgi:acyl-CoA thioesterase